MATPDHIRFDDQSPLELSRRRVLGLGAAAVASVAVGSSVISISSAGAERRPAVGRSAAAEALRPIIRPRSDWADELGVVGELVVEDDVRFLLVHHTASTNSYGPDDVIDQIRGFYGFHTGPDKGWSDVAYNFFVDRYGGIWEGRHGSIEGPVRGDATGGSQGFALLCSLIGNHHEAPVTSEQKSSLVQLLAWLGETYAVDTSIGAMTMFTSRGSNLWPAGTEVTARTISGHREMSTTTCPGDFAFPLLAEEIPSAVSLLRASATGISTTSTTSGDSSSTSSSTAESSSSTADEANTTSTPGPTPGPSAPQITGSGEEASAPATSTDPGDGSRSWPLVVAGGAMAIVAGGAGLVTRWWHRGEPSG